MTTKYEIPAYLRRAHTDATNHEQNIRQHALGYSDQSLSCIAVQIRTISSLYLEDITSRKLLETDVDGASASIDTAIEELRVAMMRLHDIKDFVCSNLTNPPDKN